MTNKKPITDFITTRNYGEGVDRSFYLSRRWLNKRKYIMEKYNYICQRCESPAVIVHHIEPLTPLNVHDEHIAYGESNLIPVCTPCHNTIHYGSEHTTSHASEIEFDTDGTLTQVEPHKIFLD